MRISTIFSYNNAGFTLYNHIQCIFGLYIIRALVTTLLVRPTQTYVCSFAFFPSLYVQSLNISNNIAKLSSSWQVQCQFNCELRLV